MTKMVNEIVMEAFKKLSPAQICLSCRSDKSDCATCFVHAGDEAPEDYDECPEFDEDYEEPVSSEQISAQMREHFASLQRGAAVSEKPGKGYTYQKSECSFVD
jgi:hypothetical protein